MKLNLQTDYALRLLMHLAVNDNRLCTIAEVSTHYGISQNHMMKVAHTLGRSGVVATVRGRGGGLKLAHPAENIVIGDIVRRVEPDFNITACFESANNNCFISTDCRLKGLLQRAAHEFLRVLDGATLYDLVNNNSGLQQLLGGAPPVRREAAQANV